MGRQLLAGAGIDEVEEPPLASLEGAERVRRVHRGRYRGGMAEVRAGGTGLRGTPHHIVPARMEAVEVTHLVYLMYRADRGYRIGRTKAIRGDSWGRPEIGYRVRMNQEHGDKLWVLRVCDDVAEAAYHEAWFAARYGLPTACFHAVGRSGMALDDDDLVRLFDNLDTRTAAKELMEDWELHPQYPHYRPQNGARRSTINLTMFSDRRGSSSLHRIQWSGNRPEVAERLSSAGLGVRGIGADRSGWRFETSRADYRDALRLARTVAEAGGLEIRRRMAVGDRIYDYTPLSHLRRGMRVLVEELDDRKDVALGIVH